MSDARSSPSLRFTHLSTLLLTLGAMALPAGISSISLLVVFLSSLHFSATWVLFFGEKDIARREPSLAIFLPLGLLLLSVGWGSLHEPSWRMALLLFFPFLFWHYAKQSMGLVALSLRGEEAFRDPRSPRRQAILAAFLILGVMGYLVTQTAARNTLAFGIYIPGIPLELGAWAAALRWASLICLGYVVFECLCARAFEAIATAIAFYLWMDLPLSNFRLLPLMPALHSLQYLPMVYQRWRGKGWSRLSLIPWLAAGLFTFGAIVLQPGARIGFAALFSALEIVMNLHHYFIDAKIWRAREERVRIELKL